jgi:hypothetical protein
MGFVTTERVEVRKGHSDRWLTRLPLPRVERLLGESCTFLYHNTLRPGAIAGNHYHRRKHEVFLCSYGELEVGVLNPETGMSEVVMLSANPASPYNVLMTFPRCWPHAVRNPTDELAIVTVFANHDPIKGDEFPFTVFAADKRKGGVVTLRSIKK